MSLPDIGRLIRNATNTVGRMANLEQNNALGGGTVPHIQNVDSDDAKRQIDGLLRTLQSAQEETLHDGPSEGDTSMRNMLVQELLGIMRENRRENAALEEEQEDIDFMARLRKDGKHTEVSKLIGFTAEFASELPHNLMSEQALARFKQNDPFGKQDWDWYCSDKLEAHVREVVEFIRAKYRRLHRLNANDLIKWNTPDEKSILTAFCRCVATRWRTSTVASGQAYKTTKQIDTIRHALLENLSFFAGVHFQNDRLVCHRPSVDIEALREMSSNLIDA